VLVCICTPTTSLCTKRSEQMAPFCPLNKAMAPYFYKSPFFKKGKKKGRKKAIRLVVLVQYGSSNKHLFHTSYPNSPFLVLINQRYSNSSLNRSPVNLQYHGQLSSPFLSFSRPPRAAATGRIGKVHHSSIYIRALYQYCALQHKTDSTPLPTYNTSSALQQNMIVETSNNLSPPQPHFAAIHSRHHLAS